MASANLKAMLNKFGVVTVMDVKLYDAKRFQYVDGVLKDGLGEDITGDALYTAGEWDAKSTFAPLEGSGATEAPFIYLDTLKVTNINAEGPNKTATGGMSADTLLKYGKKYTLEMQDAMGRYDVLEKLYGTNLSENKQILAVTDRFPGEKTLVGTTFFVDQKTGAKQPLHIVIPFLVGDGIFNLTMDAEGDITVFDLNGNILRYESEAIGRVGADGKYSTGADNSFYFMTTEKGLESIKKKGYRETWNSTTEADFETDETAGA